NHFYIVFVKPTALSLDACAGEFVLDLAAGIAEREFEIGIGQPSVHQAEKRARDHAKGGRGFAWRPEIKRWVAQKLAEAIDGDGHHAEDDIQPDGDGAQAAAHDRDAEDQATDKQRRINGNIALTDSGFVAHLRVAKEVFRGELEIERPDIGIEVV